MRRSSPSLVITGLSAKTSSLSQGKEKHISHKICNDKIEALNKEVSQLKNINLKLKAEKTSINENLQAKIKELEILKDENINMKKRYKDRYDEKVSQRVHVCQNCPKLTKEIESLNKDLEALQTNLKKLSEAFNSVKIERDLAEEFLRTTKIRLDEVSAKNDSLKYNLEDFRKLATENESKELKFKEEIAKLHQRIQIERYGADETRKAEILDLKKKLTILQNELADYVDEDRRFQQSMSEVAFKTKIQAAVKVASESFAKDYQCSACPDKDLALKAALEAIQVRDERLQQITTSAATAVTTVKFQEFLIESMELRDKGPDTGQRGDEQ